MEAMRCGKPIVTLDVGATGEVITNDVNGILLPLNESHRVAEKVIDLLNDPAYAKRLAEGALSFADKELWTWEERIAAELNEVNKLMERKYDKSSN